MLRCLPFLSGVILLWGLASPPVLAGPPDDARAALALAAARPTQVVNPPQAAVAKKPYDGPCACGNGCPCGNSCGCATAGGCSDKGSCDCTSRLKAKSSGRDAWQRAVDAGKPYLVWVGGFACPYCEEGIDGVHVHVESYRGDDTPRVEIGRPDGKGDVDHCGTITGSCSCERIRAVLAKKVVAQGGCANGVCGFPGQCGQGGCPSCCGGPPTGFFGGFGLGSGCPGGNCGGGSFGGPQMMGGGCPGGFCGGGGCGSGGCASCGGGSRRR